MSISFCIPTFNRSKDLTRAINSIISQKGLSDIKYEIIIADDSNEAKEINNNKKLIQFYSKNYNIKYIKNIKSGQFTTLNFLIRKASMDWIVFLHDDDYIDIKYLENIRRSIENNNKKDGTIDAIYLGRTLIDEDNKILGQSIALKLKSNEIKISGSKYVLKYLSSGDSTFAGNMIGPMVTGLLVRRSLIKEDLYFETDIKVNADTLFLLKIFYKSNLIVYINKPLVAYTIRDGSQRSIPSQDGSVYQDMKRVFEKMFKFLEKEGFSNNDINSYRRTFYTKQLDFNGPLLWIALRNNRGYLRRVVLQIKILFDIYKNNKNAIFNPKFFITPTVGFFPQLILKKLYLIYIHKLNNRQI